MAEATELRRDEGGGDSLLASWYRFFMSAVGAKMLMAATGIGLWLFIVAHLAGNLTAFGGKEIFNHYAEALKGNAPLLWAVRSALILGFPIHILTAIRTAALNRSARPVGYAFANKAPAALAAKTMLISGLLVMTFFAYHLAHFTWHLTGPQPTALLANGNYDAYTMLVMGFQQPLIAGLYIVGQLLLATHLSHGIYSMCQHLGLWGTKWTPFLKTAANAIAWGICVLFSAIPAGVLFGVIKP